MWFQTFVVSFVYFWTNKINEIGVGIFVGILRVEG